MTTRATHPRQSPHEARKSLFWAFRAVSCDGPRLAFTGDSLLTEVSGHISGVLYINTRIFVPLRTLQHRIERPAEAHMTLAAIWGSGYPHWVVRCDAEFLREPVFLNSHLIDATEYGHDPADWTEDFFCTLAERVMQEHGKFIIPVIEPPVAGISPGRLFRALEEL